MATVEKRSRNGKVRWYVRYRDPLGVQRAKTFDRRLDADRWLTTMEASKLTGSYVDPGRGRLKVGEWAASWFESQVHWSPTTRARYESILRNHVLPAWEGVPLADIAHSEVQSWVAQLTRTHAPASVAKTHRVLSMLLDAAVRDQRLARNPAEKVRLPRVATGERRYLTHLEVAELADRCGRYREVILFLAYTGLRWGEMAALRVARVDLAKRRIVVAESATPSSGQWIVGPTKGHERREVALPEFLVDELRAHLAGKSKQDLLFGGAAAGRFLRAKTVQDGALTPAAVEMGLFDVGEDGEPTNVFHPHEFRHTAASLAIASGADVKVVQQMLGHKSATMTLDLYGHLFPDRLDEVANAMDVARAAAMVGYTSGTHRSATLDDTDQQAAG